LRSLRSSVWQYEGWTDPESFDGDYYRLSVRLQVPESERDGQVAVGDEVAILEA
jgi:hypothetical protein